MATDYNKNAVRLIEPWVNKKIEDAVAAALESGGAIETAISAKVDAAIAAHEAKEESATFANSHVVEPPTPPAPTAPSITKIYPDNHPEETTNKIDANGVNTVIGANFTSASKVYIKSEGTDWAIFSTSKTTFVDETKLSLDFSDGEYGDDETVQVKVVDGGLESEAVEVEFVTYP